MSKRQFNGPTLPKELLSQIQTPQPASGRGRDSRTNRFAPKSRKEQRKHDRVQKRAGRVVSSRNSFSVKKHSLKHDGAPNDSDSDSDEFDEVHDSDQRTKQLDIGRNKINNVKNLVPQGFSESDEQVFDSDDFDGFNESEQDDAEPPKPPPKKAKVSNGNNTPEPTVSLKTGQRDKERLAEEDAEISKLERKLGIKKKKSGPSDGGIDSLLGDIGVTFSSDEEDNIRPKRDFESEAWLNSKRRKLNGHRAEERDGQLASDNGESGHIDQEAGSLDESEGELSEDDGVYSESTESNSDDGVHSRPVKASRQHAIRENPYKAPGSISAPEAAAKYVPPSLRARLSSDVEETTRLNRQLQGLLNRLSESNTLSIIGEIEKIYQNNARQFVTSSLINLLLTLMSDRAVLTDTFIILHAGFIAGVYKIVGPDFGAQLIEELTLKLDDCYQAEKMDSAAKRTTNLISLLSQLYIFQVIGCQLVFDYIRNFLETLCELNAELLLRIIKYSGQQLRQDDPSALKDIVLLLQRNVTRASEGTLSIRTQFMIETINDLKNNKVRTGLTSSAIAAEHTTKTKKLLGSLNSRNLKATEPLHLGLQDIRDSDKKGKWWLVGASWKGRSDKQQASIDTRNDSRSSQGGAAVESDDDTDEFGDPSGMIRLTELGRQLGMNTTIRRNIFSILLTSSDYQNAYTRLLKLHLGKKQEFEIPRVLLKCATAESGYNAYYTLIAKKLCRERSMRMAFQFCLWDFFKQCEADSGDDTEGGTVGMSVVVNYAKLYAELILSGNSAISILKNQDFVYIDAKIKVFTEVLFVTIIQQASLNEQKRTPRSKPGNASFGAIFQPVCNNPDLKSSIQYFLQKTVAKTDLVAETKGRRRLRHRCNEVLRILQSEDVKKL